MNTAYGDGNKPISVGDPSYILDGVYNPIIWIGEDPYRPRVETLVLSEDGTKVLLRLYDKVINGLRYAIPGGSLDADSTLAEQAENEINEEALISVTNVTNTGIQYYSVYDTGFSRKNGGLPFVYKGTINYVFLAKYAGPYDKSKVEEKDLDSDIAENSQFYPIEQMVDRLSREHIRALLSAGDDLIDPSTKLALALKADRKTVEYVTEDMIPEFDSVPAPGEYLYHGSTVKFDVFHPMSLDIGNAKQGPGWSTFCFDSPLCALRFALLRLIQKAIGYSELVTGWDYKKKIPYISNSVGYYKLQRIIGQMIYVYQVPTEGLDIGIGNDARLPEYTFREDNVFPKHISEITVTDQIIRANTEVLNATEISQISDYMKESDWANKARLYSVFINHDYNHDPKIKVLTSAVESGKLKPGDDVEEFMIDNDCYPDLYSVSEAVIITDIPMQLDNLTVDEDEKDRNPEEPEDTSKHNMVYQDDARPGFIVKGEVETDPSIIAVQNRHNIYDMHRYERGGSDHAQYHGTDDMPIDVDNDAMEGMVLSTDDIVVNFEDWENGKSNIVFITGLSGSGKSKLGKELAEKYNAIYVELDLFGYIVEHKTSISEISDPVIAEYIKTTNLYKRNRDVDFLSRESAAKLSDEYVRFMDWLITLSHKRGNRYVVEGIQVMLVDPHYLKKFPVVVKGTSALKSWYRSYLRDYGEKPSLYNTAIRDFVDDFKSYKRKEKIRHRFGEILTEASLTAQDRKELKDSDFGIPETKSYPMPDKLHVMQAIRMFNHVDPKYEAELAKNIKKKAKKFGITIKVSEKNRLSKYVPVTESTKKLVTKSKVPSDIIALNDKLNRFNYGAVIGNKVVDIDDFYFLKDYRSCTAHEFDKAQGGVCWDYVNYEYNWFIKHGYKNVECQYFIMDNGREDPTHTVLLFQVDGSDDWYWFESAWKPVKGIYKLDDKYDAFYAWVEDTVKTYGSYDCYCFKYIPSSKLEHVDCIQYMNRVATSEPVVVAYGKKKSRHMTESFIDQVDQEDGELSLGVPTDRSNDPRDEVMERYKKFIVAKYLYRGEYHGYTDWEDSISAYIAKKKYDIGIYFVYGNNHNYPEYLGMISVNPDNTWTWFDSKTDWFATEAMKLSGNAVMEAGNPDDDDDQATDYTAEADDDDGDQATDYTAEADDDDDGQATDYTEEDEGGEDDTDNPEEDDTAGENDGETGGDDEDTATDYTDEAEGGDEGTDTGDTGTEDTGNADNTADTDASGNPDINTLVKNHSLMRDFERIHSLVVDVMNTLNSTLKANPGQNRVLVQVSRNLTNIKDFILNFIQFHFKSDNYQFNLYYYTIIVQLLKLNLAMVEKSTKLGESDNK